MNDLTQKRIASVDIFRALTMFIMLFVNDIPGLRDVPHTLMHAGVYEDMLGFSDLVFPAFLFCMGMSVPLAIQTRYRKGDTVLQVSAHLFWRTVALIAMGLFSINSAGVPGGLSGEWFRLLMVLGFFLVWGVYPKASGARLVVFRVMKWAGVTLLAALVVYKDLAGQPFHVGWWGILGLIGWTYAVCALVYLVSEGQFRKNLVAWVVVMLLAFLSHTGWVPGDWGARIVLLPFVPSDWTLHAFGLSGLMTTLVMQRVARKEEPWPFLRILLVMGAVMALLGLACHGHWIVSKIQATPTWLFWCLAWFFPLFGMLFWLADTKGKGRWFDLIKPAGTATLTCYILPYVWYALQQMWGLAWPDCLRAGWPGLLKSLVYALVIVLLTGVLVRFKVKLKV